MSPHVLKAIAAYLESQGIDSNDWHKVTLICKGNNLCTHWEIADGKTGYIIQTYTPDKVLS